MMLKKNFLKMIYL